MAAQNDKQAWSEFDSSDITPSEVFERVVALRLFAREIGKRAHDLTLPPNFPGVESPPVEVDDEWVSFQAKYSSDLKTPWRTIRSAIEMALAKKAAGYYLLDRIFIYTSGAAAAGKKDQRHADQIEIDEIAAAGNVKLTWNFGDQVLDAARKAPDLWVLFDSTYPRLRGPGQVADYSRIPATAFVGRETEIDRLSSFINDDRPFLWWALGGRAGSGKTSLLKEFARRIPADWSLAWLGSGGEPLAPRHISGQLVLVVDGPLTHGIGRLSELLETFSSVAPSHKLRLVVVDRNPAVWDGELTAGNTNASSQLRYDEPLAVAELEEHDWTSLVRQVALALGIDASALLSEFPARKGTTPLELFLKMHGGPGGPTTAVRSLLADDRKQHYPQTSEAVLDAAAALTIVKTCDRQAIGNSEVLSTLVKNATDSAQLLRVVGTTDSTSNSSELRGISPDLIGELFVLDRWSQTPLAPVPASLNTALDLEVSGAVVDFFHRSATDYPAHPALQLLDTDPPDDPIRGRTWTLSQAAVASNTYGHQSNLSERLLRRLGQQEPTLGFQAFLILLQLRSGRRNELPSLAHFDDPALRIHVNIPITTMNDVTGEVVEDRLSEQLSQEIAELNFTPPPFGPLIRLLLVSEFCHSAKTNNLARYRRAMNLLRAYAEDVDFGPHRYTDTIKNAIIAAQHRIDRDSEWAETITGLYDELIMQDPAESVGDAAVVFVRALRNSNRSNQIVENFRLDAEQTHQWTRYFSALTHHTGPLPPQSQPTEDCAAEILRLSANTGLSPTDADILHKAANNLIQKVSQKTADALHHALLDQLLNLPGTGWGDGAQGTIREIGNRAHAAILEGDVKQVRAAVKWLTTTQIKEAFEISWPLNNAFSALASDQLGERDFNSVWKVLSPHRNLLPENRLQTHVTDWYSLVMRTKAFDGSRHKAIRSLGGEVQAATQLANALNSERDRKTS